MPSPLYADPKGRVFDLPGYSPLGLSGGDLVPIPERDLAPLPEGSQLFVIKKGILATERDGITVYLEKLRGKRIFPVAAFMPAGWTRTLMPGYVERAEIPVLPLWSYTAVAWHRGKICGAAVRVARNPKADPELHSPELDKQLIKLVERRIKENPSNRLLRQLARCALDYHCFAAKNLFYRRWELPLPTSPSCNSRCLGCLSLQEGECCASQERIDFVPTPEEISEIAVPHLQKAPTPIASFGQGCEGEPLLQYRTIERAIRLIREQTKRGTINLNTNGFSPERIRVLARAGLQAIRISLNSSLEACYDAYYRPVGYKYSDVLKSLSAAKDEGLYVNVNLLVFPGYTDQEQEAEGLIRLFRKTGVDVVQMRNLSIDPWWYIRKIPRPEGRSLGVRGLIGLFRKELPGMRIDYFNTPAPRSKNQCTSS